MIFSLWDIGLLESIARQVLKRYGIRIYKLMCNDYNDAQIENNICSDNYDCLKEISTQFNCLTKKTDELKTHMLRESVCKNTNIKIIPTIMMNWK